MELFKQLSRWQRSNHGSLSNSTKLLLLWSKPNSLTFADIYSLNALNPLANQWKELLNGEAFFMDLRWNSINSFVEHFLSSRLKFL